MTKKRAEPSTFERLTEARNKRLKIFDPEFMSGTEQVVDHLNRHLDGEFDEEIAAAQEKTAEEEQAPDGDDGDGE